MKKSITLSCIILVILLLLGSAFACTDGTRSLSFTEKEYHLYLQGGESSVTPEVLTRPRGNEYTLSVSNKTIAKVEGNTVTALKEGLVTLSATSGQFTVSVPLYVHSKLDASNDVYQPDDGKHSVYFESDYFVFPVQRIENGGVATLPESPFREGYTLFGWYLDSECTVPYDFATPVTSNVTLYALWSATDPVYDFETKDDLVYLKGFKIKRIPYESATLPTTDNDGNAVYGISAGAFKDSEKLETVTIPDGYKVVGDSAFEGCTALETVTFEGASLEKINYLAFSGCTSLTTVTFGGEGLTFIGASCFENCHSLASINLPNSVQTIESKAFKQCNALNISKTPDSLEVLSQEVFAFTAIKSIDVSGVTAIYNQAFWGTTTLETVLHPENLTYVASYCFGSLLSAFEQYATAWLKNTHEISKYRDVEGSSVTYLGNVLVYVSPVGVGTKPLPTYIKQTTTVIAGEAFSDVSNATAYFIGFNPPKYGTNAFGAQTSNSNVTRPTVDVVVPQGKTADYARAFLITNVDEEGYYVPTEYSLALVQKIYEMPSAENSILDLMIYGRRPLKNVTPESSQASYYSKLLAKEAGDPFAGLVFDDAKRNYVIHSYVGTATTLDVKALLEAECGQTVTPTIERISSYAFSSNVTLETLTLIDRISYVDEWAFAECQKLSRLYLIGDGTFTPSDYAIQETSFNGPMIGNVHGTFKVLVHANQLSTYNNRWGTRCPSLKGKFEALP